MRTSPVILSIATLLAQGVFAVPAAADQGHAAGLVAKPGPVFAGTYVGTTQRFILHAAANGVDYDVWVSLPEGYASGGRRYPMLLQLDGVSQFALAATSARLIHDDHLVDDMIVVGIAAAGPVLQHEAQRLSDYTPDGVPASLKSRMLPYLEKGFKAEGMTDAAWQKLAASPIYGGAPKFLEFLTKELLPRLQRDYRIDPDKMGISGHSVGGAFVTYALLMGAPFSRYSIGSYTADWYGDRIPALVAATARRDDRRKIGIYEAHGDYEMIQLASLGGQATLDRALGLLDDVAKARPGFVTVTHRVIADEGHSGMVPAQIAGGIRVLFGPDQAAAQ